MVLAHIILFLQKKKRFFFTLYILFMLFLAKIALEMDDE